MTGLVTSLMPWPRMHMRVWSNCRELLCMQTATEEHNAGQDHWGNR